MTLFYDTTPWLIPKADEALKNIFHRVGFFHILEKGNTLQARNLKGDGRNIIFLESGLLGQSYNTTDINKPHFMSLVLPGRIINYFAHLGIDNRRESILILRDSTAWTCPLDKLRSELEAENLSESFQRYCMECVASDYGAFTCMFSMSTEARLLQLFASLIRSLNCPKGNGRIHIPLKLTYAELSWIMHTNIKTIERVLAKWHKSGVLASAPDGFSMAENAFADPAACA